ncbi:UNVERIFIED_CONTAM: hypothetical protein Scaly_2889200 [Sesamum calycinum]|uniref:Uncharacterized protein n=1 Tax=Sesamum calycinum TaxID=2727403 RepID=A0AAW2L7A5_9LAMI
MHLAVFPGLGKNHQAWDLAISAHAHGRLSGTRGLAAINGTCTRPPSRDWEKQRDRGPGARPHALGASGTWPFFSFRDLGKTTVDGGPGSLRAVSGKRRGGPRDGRDGGGGGQSKRQRAESQRIVAARPLCRLQYPVAYLSRLQRILPAARWELYFKAADAARPPRRLGQRHVPLGARGPLLRVGKRTGRTRRF